MSCHVELIDGKYRVYRSVDKINETSINNKNY